MRHEFIPLYIPYSPRTVHREARVRGRARILPRRTNFLGQTLAASCLVSMLIIYGAHDYGRHRQTRLPDPRFGAVASQALRDEGQRLRPFGGAMAPAGPA